MESISVFWIILHPVVYHHR